MKIHEEHCKESLSCMSVKTMQLLTQMILSYIVLCRWQRLNLQEMLEIDQELCMMEAFGNLGSGKKCRCLPTARFNANIQILDSFDSFTIQRSISRLQVRFISCYCSTAKDPVLKCNLFEKKSNFGLWPGRVLGGACIHVHSKSLVNLHLHVSGGISGQGVSTNYKTYNFATTSSWKNSIEIPELEV